jgi:hypothetical protein
MLIRTLAYSTRGEAEGVRRLAGQVLEGVEGALTLRVRPLFFFLSAISAHHSLPPTGYCRLRTLALSSTYSRPRGSA